MGLDGSLDRVWAFLGPNQRVRIEAAEARSAKHLYSRLGEQFDPLKTKFASKIALDGEHYAKLIRPLRIFRTRPVLFDGAFRDRIRRSPGGKWGYANRVLPAWTWLEIMQGHKRGHVVFSADVPIPTLLRLPRCATVSSCTPMEMFTMRQGVRRATGTVLVGGLGLGWFLRLVAAKRSVRRVILVEKSEDLLDWYGRDLCARIAKENDTPIEVICDDVWNHVGQHGDEVRHAVDIWNDYPTYLYQLDKEHQQLIRSVKHFWGWGLLAEPAERWY